MSFEEDWTQRKAEAIAICHEVAQKFDQMADQAAVLARDRVNLLAKQVKDVENRYLHQVREEFYRGMADEAKAKAEHVKKTWPDDLFRHLVLDDRPLEHRAFE